MQSLAHLQHNSAAVPPRSEDEDPRKSEDEDPRRSEDEDPRRSEDEDPRKSEDEDPRRSEDEDPRKSEDEDPRRSEDEDPRKSEDEDPRRSEGEDPRRSEDGEPARTESQEVILLQTDAQPCLSIPNVATSPSTSDQDSNNLLLLALKLRHNLTCAAVNDISKLVNYISGFEAVARSKYFMNKAFANITNDFEFHHLCRSCQSYIGIAENGVLKCPNVLCNHCEKESFDHNLFFMYVPLRKQLTDLFENHNVSAEIINPKLRQMQIITDIYDGELYKDAMSGAAPSDISLTFNCDGVPVFKSSSCAIWPILCTVNELPPKLRKQHVLLVSLWFGSDKPKMNVYFQPFVNEIEQLSKVGFLWVNPNNQELIRTKVKVLVGVCDTVARPLLQNFKQFNGLHGCGFCLQPGQVTAKGNGFARSYSYDKDAILRTEEATNELAEEALTTGVTQFGVKGPSILSLLPTFNIIDGLVPDYMHSALLGVTRQMAYLWFDSKNHAEPFYMGKSISSIDRDLLSIKPTCDTSRLPRSVLLRKFWKAHEWFSFLLYYSLPILKSYLPAKFYNHWSLLVEGVSVLLSENITVDSTIHSELVFIQFVIDMAKLYGDCNVTFNVHLCLHLAKSVRDWGPLWTHSAFVFEDYNAKLFDLFKGTQAIPIQICKTFALSRALPSLSDKLVSAGCTSEYSELLGSFVAKKTVLQNSTTVHNNITLLGRPRIRALCSAHHLALHTVSVNIVKGFMVRYFRRIIVKGEIVHSMQYCRQLKRNSYTVELADGTFFSIETFIVANLDGICEQCYAIGFFFEVVSGLLCRNTIQEIYLAHIISVTKVCRGHLVAIKADKIKRKCIFISSRNQAVNFICRQLSKNEYCA